MISVKNIFTVLVALLLSGILVTASFSGGNSEAYLFPRIISSIMMFLAILLLIFHFNEKHHQDQKINIAKIVIKKGLQKNSALAVARGIIVNEI